MAGTLVSIGEAARRFRTTEIALKKFVLRGADGAERRWESVDTQQDVLRGLAPDISGVFYMNLGKLTGPVLYGVRAQSGQAVFNAGIGAFGWLIIVFWFVVGLATIAVFGLGLLFIAVAIFAWMQQAQAAHARKLFLEDEKQAS